MASNRRDQGTGEGQAAAAAPRYAELRLALVDPPEAPLRSTVAGESLEDLAASLRANGVIEPLIVCERPGGRFRVVAGHRRWSAAQLAGLEYVPCVIRNDDAAHQALQLAENIDREELRPADEAEFVRRVFDECGGDIDAAAAKLRRPRAYVDRYLALLDGYAPVLEELRRGRIGVGQAEQLNRAATEQIALHLLQYVTASGATVRQVRDWIQQYNASHAHQAAAAAAAAEGGSAPAQAPLEPPAAPVWQSMARPYEVSGGLDARQCRLCSAVDIESNMWRWFVCAPCGNEFTQRAVRMGEAEAGREARRGRAD